MLLAIDAGNTNIVFGIYDGDALRCHWRAATSPARTADEYAALLAQWMTAEGLQATLLSGAIIASVVPRALSDLRHLVERLGHTPLVVGDPQVRLDIEVRIDRPAEVGADRLVNAVAAHSAYGGPLIVLDFGTATTFDVVDGDGNYCGGVIAPGIKLSLEALHTATAKLPRIGIEKPEHVVGRGTVGAMRSGIYWGYVGLIEGIVARIQAEEGGERPVVATGGLAPLFAGGTDLITHVEPELTLRGLREIWERNRS
jgi:type III pantothenate kinase